MPFDTAGARQAGYSDDEIAGFLASQSGFDLQGATKAGYSTSDVVSFLSERAGAAPQPAQGDPMGSGDFSAAANPPAAYHSVLEGAPLPKPVVTDAQEAENNRLSRRAYAEGTPTVDDARALAPSMTATPAVARAPAAPAQQREVGALESLGRGFGRAGAETARMPALLASAAGVAFDALHGAVTGKQETGAQDAMFRNLVDPRQRAVDWYALGPDEKQGFLGKVADSVGAMVQDLPLMLASGGVKQRQELAQQFPTLLRFLEDSVGQGFEAMRPIMVKAGTEKAKQVLDAGGTTAQALNSATVAALWTGMSGSQPMSAAGSLPSRIATGVPVGMAQEEAGRAVQNAADPAGLQRHFDPAEMVAGGVTNAIAAGALGHGASGRVPDRIELGYDPMTGKTPVAAAVQGMGEAPTRLAPGHAEPARDPITRIAEAPTVDAAIQAAQEAVDSAAPVAPALTLEQELAGLRQRTGGAQSVGDEMRAIRPANPVDAGEMGELGHESAQAQTTDAATADLEREAIARAHDDGTGLAQPLAQGPAPAAAVEAAPIPTEPGRDLRGGAAAAAVPLGSGGEHARPNLAQTPADAGVSASGARPYQVERTESGSLVVRGDKATIREALANLPPNAMVPTRDGIQVATTWSERAERVLQAFDPAAYSEFNGKKVSIKVEAEDGTQATLKMDAGRALRATDARERELQRLRECVGGRA